MDVICALAELSREFENQPLSLDHCMRIVQIRMARGNRDLSYWADTGKALPRQEHMTGLRRGHGGSDDVQSVLRVVQ